MTKVYDDQENKIWRAQGSVSGCNYKHAYLRVSPIELNGLFDNMHLELHITVSSSLSCITSATTI